eukprot:TRINITY_DN1810_c1_g1_i1.p1 TRINITY_DN1810_c1_g1~~TRINITY_DN1810_c1_g1_i1.p1  ORF type:complete len:271 (+),score=49.76 TRINITY_DN1810_c1_g1_i1:147-959(+)
MRPLMCISTLLCVTSIKSQGINFGGSSSSSGSNSGSNSGSSSGSNSGNTETDQRILGIIPGISTGNTGTDNLINGGLLGAGLVAGAGLLTGAIDPCGRKKRQANFGGSDGNADGDDGTNTRFFNPLCNTNTNNFNNGGSGSFGGGSSFGSGCNCQCSSLTFTSNGQTYGNCRTPDNTGRYWCYTTGWNNNGCNDLKSSSRYPNNPWSYNACNVQGQCYNNVVRDCRGRPQGDKFYGCGCTGRKKRQTTKFFDIRCAGAAILGRNAPNQQK